MIPEAFNLQTAEEKMSEQIDPAPAQGAENAESSVTEEKPAETTPSTTTEVDAAQVKTPMKKVKSKKDLKNDPNRFELPGVNFNAKLIGIDDVESARGDKMCQEAMHKLKIAVKTSGQHKQRVIVNVSLDGIRIIDLRTQTTHHSHPVHRISFISRDLTDGRAFGYVFGAGEGKHKFFAIKTEKAAEALVLTLRDLFQVVYDLKKKEMEEAKHKVEEKAEEAKEEEPVYQVPNKAVRVENGTVPAGDSNESTYEVPPNNAPVNDTSKNLLVLETEMEAIEKRIEEINTMDELFKELEAPPVSTANSSSGSSWSSDLAGLSSPAQPAFTMGGGPVPGSQPFMQQPGFPAQNMQPGVMNAPFGTAPQQGNPMGNPGFGGQPAQANPFQAPPTIPARPGMGFPGQQPVGFPQAQQPGPGFPGTPFPGFQQPAFPPVPQRGGPSPQPVINVQPPNDPFGSDPFQTGGTEFEEGILTPAKLETQATEQAEQPKKKDVFEDLVNIGTKTEPTKSPKDLFVDLSAPPKVSLNQMKSGNRTPSPKPPSPFGNQASRDDSSPSTVSNVSRTSAPAVCDDPFANDPFALSTSTVVASSFSNIQTAQQTDHIAQPSVNDAEVKGDIFSDDDFNLPSPEGPPPPLPDDIISQSINVESHIRPEPPPRPVNTHQTPPLPPRPRSSQSDSVKNMSVKESPSVNHLQTPPLPPRPRTTPDAIAVPRPKPRSFNHKDLQVNEVKKSSFVNSDAEIKSDKDLSSRNERMTRNSNITKIKDFAEPKSETASKNSIPKNSWTPSVTSPKIADPFESTDPFATDDPFTQADPFSGDPFAADPFSEPVLTNNTQPYTSNDPFTSVVASPNSTTANSDPFSVFDKAFTSDSFKFDRTSVKKVKLKGTAN